MYPKLTEIGPIILYSYGLMIALGFVAGMLVALGELRRKGLDSSIAYDLLLATAVGGIVGARLAFVANNWMEFLVNPGEVFAIWEGGLMWYGGLLGGALAVLLVVRLRRLPTWQIADVMAPALAIGAAVGRWGCFLNGCCGGVVTKLPWGLRFPTSVVRHLWFELGGLKVYYFTTYTRPGASAHFPTQLYESLYNIVLFAILWRMRGRGLRDGALLWVYLVGYSIARFIVEFWRVNPNLVGPLSGSQLISIGVFAFSSVMLGLWLRPKPGNPDDPAKPGKPAVQRARKRA